MHSGLITSLPLQVLVLAICAVWIVVIILTTHLFLQDCSRTCLCHFNIIFSGLNVLDAPTSGFGNPQFCPILPMMLNLIPTVYE
jgi:hypothetical protein